MCEGEGHYKDRDAILLQLYAWLVGGIENRVRKREGERGGERRKSRKGWGVDRGVGGGDEKRRDHDEL